MATTVPTIKSVTLASEDTYRKEKMVARLKSRGMLTEEAEKYILKGKR
jgi:hypothetical protein